MGRVREAVRSRWQGLYRRSSIQMILSLSFTAVAVVGMVFMGLTLFLRFSYTTNAQQAENQPAAFVPGELESGRVPQGHDAHFRYRLL